MFYPGKWTLFNSIYAAYSRMKKKDVPQQPHQMFDGETKGVYAVNEQGNYELSQTSGWQAETDALNQALDEINRLSSNALQRAKNGLCSPLEYHMYRQRMDLAMLAKAAGKFKWQVRRHFNPVHFKQLKTHMLTRYAQVLDVDAETLKQLPDD